MNTVAGSPNVKLGRNDPCPCGSGKKSKKCCGLTGAWGAADPRVSLRPAGPGADSLNELAALLQAGHLAELEQRAQELLARHPDSGLVWKVLGLALWLRGKPALEALSRTTELLPDDAESHTNLGNAFRAVGRLDDSVKSHRRALALDPDYAEAHNNLGGVLQDLGYLEEAMASFRRALTVRPNFALAHSNLANILTLLSRASEAEESCRRALEIDPRHTGAIVQLAEFQAGKGHFVEAEALMSRAIAIEPEMPEAWAGLVRWRKMAKDGAWLAQAQRIVGQRLPPRREVPLRYALGKYFDDVSEYENAFGNFRRGNELTKQFSAPYGRTEMTEQIDRITRVYDPQWLSRTATGSASDRPIFIVGMWRSGTTLAEQILASHPDVFGAGEVNFWRCAATAHERTAPHSGTDGEALREMSGDYLALLQGLAPDALRVIDKMCGNFLHLGLIHAAFPNARIIHMQRHPIDACLSIYFQNFQNTHSFANDLDNLAHYYREYHRVMEHWRRALPKHALLEVPYESLVDDPEAWSRAMVDFIGLPWHPSCKHFDRANRSVATFSKWQVRQPINKSSVERWRNYESFVGPLLPLAQLSFG